MLHDNHISSEIKNTEISEAFNEFMHAFDMFRDANDRRFSELERRMGADIITKEKVDRISHALDEQKNALDSLRIKASRPQLGGYSMEMNEYKHAFDSYIRTGEKKHIQALNMKTVLGSDTASGGYLVPDMLEDAINSSLKTLSPIRALASVKKISSSALKKITLGKELSAGWAEEKEARNQSSAPELRQMKFATFELYVMPAISQTLLQDSAVNLDEWIISEVEKAFAEQENQAFIAGNGEKMPHGFTSYESVTEDQQTSDKLVCLTSGPLENEKALTDKLVDLVYSLAEGYRQNATWIMNRSTQALIRKMKDNQGNYLWQPPASAGQRASLLGFPLVESEQMPNRKESSQDSFSPVAFGDFARGYLVLDRTGVQILRDPYSAKPNVLFYVTKRIGGGVQDFQAIRLLKVV